MNKVKNVLTYLLLPPLCLLIALSMFTRVKKGKEKPDEKAEGEAAAR